MNFNIYKWSCISFNRKMFSSNIILFETRTNSMMFYNNRKKYGIKNYGFLILKDYEIPVLNLTLKILVFL